MDAGRKCIDKLRPSPPHPYCSRPGTWSILPPTKQNPYRDNGDAHTDNIHHSPPQTTPPTPTRKYEVLQLRHSHTRTRILCCLTSLVSYRQTFHVSILTLDIWDGMYSMQYYGQRARGGSWELWSTRGYVHCAACLILIIRIHLMFRSFVALG